MVSGGSSPFGLKMWGKGNCLALPPVQNQCPLNVLLPHPKWVGGAFLKTNLFRSRFLNNNKKLKSQIPKTLQLKMLNIQARAKTSRQESKFDKTFRTPLSVAPRFSTLWENDHQGGDVLGEGMVYGKESKFAPNTLAIQIWPLPFFTQNPTLSGISGM